jgi:hypothetical protein
MRVRWLDVISNIDLWTTTKQKQIDLQIKERKRKWIWHTAYTEK